MGRFERAVGLTVVGVAALAAVVVLLIARAGEQSIGRSPSVVLVVVSVAAALGSAGAVVLLASWVTTRVRRDDRPSATPLAPDVVTAETESEDADPVTVTALIPAHNEEGRIRATLAALRDQTRVPDRIIVVADNCSDYTVNVARAWGVEVRTTVGNRTKKAGALNQALAEVLPDLRDDDTVLVMDADTVIEPGFVEAAVRRMTDDRALMAVDGLVHGEPGGGLLGQLQRNEYARYARDLHRRRGRVFPLTGTASIFRVGALRTVAAERGRTLPGRPGEVYDAAALTEDDGITLALRSLGAMVIEPADCRVAAEPMPTWRDLSDQRLRWQRGALENLADHGVRSQTLRYWLQQLGVGYGVLALASYVVAMVVAAVALDEWIWFPFWLGAGLVVGVERVLSVWDGGWRARALALPVLPELCYSLFLGVVHVKGALDLSFERDAPWSHVVGGGDLSDIMGSGTR
jgi:cellulose synthase/poly-beta-1,6-N-acetylglucosamine synthase-like glycosyltransferase